eukprot:5324663-Pyramimonas_sp.AAC.1
MCSPPHMDSANILCAVIAIRTTGTLVCYVRVHFRDPLIILTTYFGTVLWDVRRAGTRVLATRRICDSRSVVVGARRALFRRNSWICAPRSVSSAAIGLVSRGVCGLRRYHRRTR